MSAVSNHDNNAPSQERIAESHGSQCGFCTPGITMALYSYLQAHPAATAGDIEDSLDGNLCRCTGTKLRFMMLLALHLFLGTLNYAL